MHATERRVWSVLLPVMTLAGSRTRAAVTAHWLVGWHSHFAPILHSHNALTTLHCTSLLLQRIATGKKVPKSAVNLLLALRSYRIVLVQDALDLAPQFPNDPVIRWFMEQPEFPPMLKEYQRKLAAGVRWEDGLVCKG